MMNVIPSTKKIIKATAQKINKLIIEYIKIERRIIHWELMLIGM